LRVGLRVTELAAEVAIVERGSYDSGKPSIPSTLSWQVHLPQAQFCPRKPDAVDEIAQPLPVWGIWLFGLTPNAVDPPLPQSGKGLNQRLTPHPPTHLIHTGEGIEGLLQYLTHSPSAAAFRRAARQEARKNEIHRVRRGLNSSPILSTSFPSFCQARRGGHKARARRGRHKARAGP
jgi:hypothetical protein